jgi:hypothetical protein
MLRACRGIIITVLLLSVFILDAVQEEFMFPGEQEVFLNFENVKLNNINFYDGNEIIVKYDKKDDLNIEISEKLLSLSSRYETRISLKLPGSKSYRFSKDGADCFFNAEMLEITTDDENVRFTRDKLEVFTSDDTKVEIGEKGILVVEDDQRVEISSDGIIIEGDENRELTGFWGKMLGGLIKTIVKTSISLVGKSPEKIAKHIINNDEGKNEFSNSFGFNLNNKDTKSEVLEWEFYPAAKSKLSLHNINGPIEINSWNMDYMRVKITKATQYDEVELQQVEIVIEEGEEFSIATEHLSRNPRVQVNYTIDLPEEMELDNIVTTNGSITINNTSGNCELLTLNGSLNIKNHQGDILGETSNSDIIAEEVQGKLNATTSNSRIIIDNVTDAVSAKTSNGSIKITQCPVLSEVLTSNGRIELEIIELQNDLDIITNNSKIRLQFSSRLDADIRASTTNGKISTDLPGLTADKINADHLSGQLGSGGYLLRIQTSNSNIYLESLDELL